MPQSQLDPKKTGREANRPRSAWLNSTTLGIGLTSLFSDWSHETATSILPAFLASLGAGPGWLGVIEGAADGLSSISKLAAGHFTDRLRRRKPLVLTGYLLTALGTGALAFTARVSQVLLARTSAWFGRGIRTPGRKTLLAAGVPANAYGRAFGFERMMDTLGAVAGPVTALWLLRVTAHNYRNVFLWTLLPGTLAIACFGFLVRESLTRERAGQSFWVGLRTLPGSFRQFVAAVGIFGLGDFSHTLLILYATQALAPAYGKLAAASIAVSLYLLHNVFYAASAFLGGWLGDRVSKRAFVLAAGYGLAAVMALILALGPKQVVPLAAAFVLAGMFVGIAEALEDSMAAELVPPDQHGMGFGSLAAINAVGDFASSFIVGLLWSRVSQSAAFGFAGALFLCGAVLILRLGALPRRA